MPVHSVSEEFGSIHAECLSPSLDLGGNLIGHTETHHHRHTPDSTAYDKSSLDIDKGAPLEGIGSTRELRRVAGTG
jgi:hypothetical protein